MPGIVCENEYCPYIGQGPESLLVRLCGCPRNVKISPTGECEIYWIEVAKGNAKDIREIPLSENPRLEPLYNRKEIS